MRKPRIRIASLMVAIALTALDCGAIRAVSDHRGFVSIMLALGALPMANILALGLLVGCLHRGSRYYLIGFEFVGAMALAFYVTTILFPPHRESGRELIMVGYVRPVWDLWPNSPVPTIPRPLFAWLAIALWLTWPQLALATVGGLFTRLPASLRPRPSPE